MRRNCGTCRHREVKVGCEPCYSCRLSGMNHPNWEEVRVKKDIFKYVDIGPDVEAIDKRYSEKRRVVINAMVELARCYGCKLYVENAYDFDSPILDLAFLENDEGRKTILALGFKLDEVKFKTYSTTTLPIKLDDGVLDTVARALSDKIRHTSRVLDDMDITSVYPTRPIIDAINKKHWNYFYGSKLFDEVNKYCKNDVEATMEMFMAGGRSNGKTLRTLEEAAKKIGCRVVAESWFKSVNMPGIEKVIFSGPCTIVLWDDNTKTVVRAQEGELFDPEKGLAMALSKKALGNKGSYFDEFKKWLPEEKKEEPTAIQKVVEEMKDPMWDLSVAPDESWKDALIKYLQSIGEVGRLNVSKTI